MTEDPGKTESSMRKLEPDIDTCLYQNRKAMRAEVVYEVTTLKNALPFGIAVADIEQSEPHFHKVTTETYTVVQGHLEVSLDGEQHLLHPGDVIKILPDVTHSARSLDETPARITVTTIPEWTQEDYYPVK
jgi:quercetin dioxygenase-like cupin family protein